MISVRIQGKPFNITILQVCAPTTGAEEAEVDQFYDSLQHLLELTPKNVMGDNPPMMGDWNAKVGSQKITGITGKFGLGVQNEAGHRLVEFCQENTMVIANTLFQQPKRRLYTWTSPDGQHRNQIDYVLCSQRWRSFIQAHHEKGGLDESPVGIKIAGRNINNLRYADDTTLMAESEEELKSLLMRVKEKSAKVGLKLNVKKTKIMASGVPTERPMENSPESMPLYGTMSLKLFLCIAPLSLESESPFEASSSKPGKTPDPKPGELLPVSVFSTGLDVPRV
ncbi:Craniofacial development protein 2 [Varanus komodoensis]|nr:Craniofacial development protein 2 [Varanus komodoensis]